MAARFVKPKIHLKSTKIVSNFMKQAARMMRLRIEMSKTGWALRQVNKKFTKHMEYRDTQMVKFKLKWQKVFLDLIRIGKKMSIHSFIELEKREKEVTVSTREHIFKTIFKCESIRIMKKVLSKKLRANENYQMNLIRMDLCVEEEEHF